jgi:sn-glycerol 3-phosphate transport system ATP-binding protein
MNGGVVEQVGKPLDVYARPATAFVAAFIGAPPMNFIALKSSQGSAPEIAGLPEGAAILGIRPEDFTIGGDERPGDVVIALLVDAVEHVGAETFIYASCAPATPAQAEKPAEMIVRVAGQNAPSAGERITVRARRGKLHFFSADGRKRLSV